MRVKKYLYIVVVNVLIFMAGIELVGLGFYYQSDGQLFYTNRQAAISNSENTSSELQTLPKVFHPAFGLTNPSGILLHEQGKNAYLSRLFNTTDTAVWSDISTNNHGFYSKYDYPYSPSVGEPFVVGIVGGSVAQWFALHSGETLAAELKHTSFVNGKDVVILNFAQGGVKQPQQLQVLTYFLALSQPLDLVINIDGFNEIVLGARNINEGIDIGLPNSKRFLPLAGLVEGVAGDRTALVAMAEIERIRGQMERIESWQSRVPSAALYIGLRTRHQMYQSELLKVGDALEERATTNIDPILFSIQPAAKYDSNNGRMEALTQLWATSSIMTHQLLEARGISYMHVLQPSQYFSAHNFSSEEKKIAFHPSSFYRELIQKGYPHLREQMQYLEESGVYVLDATPLFDDVDESVFGDTCCHLNDSGDDLLADAILQSLKQTL